MCIGGPALVYYVSPTEEEIFLKYNPDLQKRSLENRFERQQDFDAFVGRLKEYSKSDKPIWEAQRIDIERRRTEKVEADRRLMAELQKRKEEMKQNVRGVPGGSL